MQVHFHSGDYIIRQGAVGDTFYIIVSGQVATHQTSANSVVLTAELDTDLIHPWMGLHCAG